MFHRKIDFSPVGQLTTQGQRKIWQGTWLLSEFGQKAFRVEIDGELDKPTELQQIVLQNFYHNRVAILDLITEKLVSSFHHDDWYLPENIHITADNLWQFLSPEIMTLDNPNNKRSYYGNGSDMLLSIGFLTEWSEDFGIQIYLKNGVEFDGIGTE